MVLKVTENLKKIKEVNEEIQFFYENNFFCLSL